MPRNAAAASPAEIAYWLGQQRTVPTPDHLVQRFAVSRPTAYRWVAFARSKGQASQRDCVAMQGAGNGGH